MKLSVHTDNAFQKVVEIIRSSDASFTNLEMLFHDYESYASAVGGGTYMRAEPELAQELAWAGFNMVSRANNHAIDYGVEGMRLTTKYVRMAGIAQAGVGECLREAREACYLDTDRARFALISVTSTFPEQGTAGESWGDTKPRPGVSPLRHWAIRTLMPAQYSGLQAAMTAAGLIVHEQVTDSGERAMVVFDRYFALGEKSTMRSEPFQGDVAAITAVVRNASRQADYTIVSCHSHEAGLDRFTPPDFLVAFARAMVDAGADVFAGSGPHVLRGIELYRGKPIFYSLGNFIFENETISRQPPENYTQFNMLSGAGVADYYDLRTKSGKGGFPTDEFVWESVVATPQFEDKKLVELKLFPITLGMGNPRSQRGRPRIASPEKSQKIIADLSRLSAQFGTNILFANGIGRVDVESV